MPLKWFLSWWYIWRKICTYVAPTLTLSPKERSEIRHDNLGVLSGVSKMISESMVRSTQTVHLSCIKISTISESNKTSFHLSLCHLVVPSGAFKTIFWAYGKSSANHAPILHRHKHCLQMERREIPHDPRHLGVPSGASKMISEPMVCFTQTMHLSCF